MFQTEAELEAYVQGCVDAELSKYSDDEPRDERGRWTVGGAGGKGKLKATARRAWKGEAAEIKADISKQEAGRLGEHVVLEYLKQVKGYKDAEFVNAKQANFPVDLLQDHAAIEVKTGLVSNGKSAQHWRATIGQPGKAETAWLKKASDAQKRAWNERKAQKILDRKQAALKALSKQKGAPVKGFTMTTIIHPDTRTADLYRFKGFHLRIAWDSDQARKGYIGSYKF